jgi:WD40 repeat protein
MPILHNENLLKLIFTNDSLFKIKQTFDKTKNSIICNILLKILSFEKIMRSIKHSSILVNQEGIVSLSLLPNGDLISMSDNTMHIWDGNTFICTKTITNDDAFKSLIILSDGNIATSCANGIIKFWDTSDLRCIKTISLTKKYNLAKLFLLSNNNLACNNLKHIVKDFSEELKVSIIILDHNQDFKIIKRLKEAYGNSPMANLSGNKFVYACRQGTIKILNMLNNYECLETLTSENETLKAALLYIAKKDILLSASLDSSIKVWDVNAYRCIRTIDGQLNWVFELLLFKNGYFISCSLDGFMKVWDLNSFECVNALESVRNQTSPVLLKDYRIACILGENKISAWNY